MDSRPRICVDFDGTIFDGKELLPGCIETLARLQQKYSIAIFSARQTEAERKQMVDFLISNHVPHDEILPAKPPAEFYIDDRGIKFESWDQICLS